MGANYIGADVVQQQRFWLHGCIASVILLCILHGCLTESEWKGPTITDLGDGNTRVVTRVYYRQYGWLLVTNTFYTGKK